MTKFNPKGNQLIASAGRYVTIIETVTGKENALIELPELVENVCDITFSEDGRSAALWYIAAGALFVHTVELAGFVAA